VIPPDQREHLPANTAAATLNLTETAPVHPGFSRAMMLFVVLQGLDLVTTLLAFRYGGVELNPLPLILMTWMGRGMAVLLCKAILVAVIWSFRRHKRVLRFGNVLYIGVVTWNVVMFTALR
jgi:hypothetical protein